MLETPQESGLKWLFLDMNSFFASVEQQENPRLRNKPIAVVPMMTKGTCAIAASYEAKKYGIKTGTKIYDALRLCPDLICVPAQHDLYVRYHHRVLDEVIRHTPINKVWSIDELSSRLPPNKRNIESATAIAHAIKQGFKNNIGSCITASIGIAPNGYLGKVASDMQKPDGLVILQPAQLQEKLFTLKLTDFPGINVRMQERLRLSGITSIEQFWHLSPKHARRVWGSVDGEKFWYNLHGYDVPVQETNRSMIGHSRVLDMNLRSPDKARDVVRRLTIKAASRLRRQGFYASIIDLSVRTDEFGDTGQKFSHGMKITPAQDNFSFLSALDQLWRNMMITVRPYRLKKVSIVLHGLCLPEQITPDLFDMASPAKQTEQKKQTALSQLMDTINQKYGAEAIQLGISPKTSAGYMGTKIAFSRIPDPAEFNE